jgi:hypothetical protein
MYLSDGGIAEKVITFLSTFLKRKHAFGAKTGHFFTIGGLKERGRKCVVSRIYEVKG